MTVTWTPIVGNNILQANDALVDNGGGRVGATRVAGFAVTAGQGASALILGVFCPTEIPAAPGLEFFPVVVVTRIGGANDGFVNTLVLTPGGPGDAYATIAMSLPTTGVGYQVTVDWIHTATA